MIKHVSIALVFIAVLNFAVDSYVAATIGGSAINGKVEHGHYYVGSHGNFTEVSRAVWTYSYIHGFSQWITFPLFFFGVWLMHRQKTLRNTNIG